MKNLLFNFVRYHLHKVFVSPYFYDVAYLRNRYNRLKTFIKSEFVRNCSNEYLKNEKIKLSMLVVNLNSVS